jgi:hypothetical protein
LAFLFGRPKVERLRLGRSCETRPRHLPTLYSAGALESEDNGKKIFFKKKDYLQKLEEKLPELDLRRPRIRVHRTELFPFFVRILVRKARSSGVGPLALILVHVAFVVRISREHKNMREFELLPLVLARREILVKLFHPAFMRTDWRRRTDWWRA